MANVEFKVYDREMNVLKVHRKHADKDISDWVTRDGVNAYSFLPHELLDETLAKVGTLWLHIIFKHFLATDSPEIFPEVLTAPINFKCKSVSALTKKETFF